MNIKKLFYNLLVIFLFLILSTIIYKTVIALKADVNQIENKKDVKEIVESRIKIGFSLGTLKEERWIKDRDILMAKVKEMGADILVQNANNDDKDQLKQVKYLLDQNIDVLIIVPNDYSKAAYAVELAKKQGVKVISYDRLVLEANVDMYISFDSIKVGELMAQYASNKVLEGNYLVINGPKSDNNTDMIKKGYDKILQQKINEGTIKIISEERAPNWMKEYAFKATNGFLQKEEKIDAVIAGNDGLAEGVIEALAEHRLAGSVAVVGQDADLSACQRVVEGTQLMTVYKPIEKLAETTAKIAIDLAKDKKIDFKNTMYDGKYYIPAYVLEPIAVDQRNIGDTVIKDGFHIKDDIYRNIN